MVSPHRGWQQKSKIELTGERRANKNEIHARMRSVLLLFNLAFFLGLNRARLPPSVDFLLLLVFGWLWGFFRSALRTSMITTMLDTTTIAYIAVRRGPSRCRMRLVIVPTPLPANPT